MGFIKRLFNKLVMYRNIYNTAEMKVENMTPVFHCSESKSFKKASDYLINGYVIAVPTDTVYGLACSAICPETIKKLYSIKGRDSSKPVAICVTHIEDIRKWGNADHLPDDLLTRIVPGPVTVVLEKTKNLNNPFLNPNTTKIGIRIPNYKFMNELTKAFDMPVALTSANFSNESSTLSVDEFKHLYPHLGAVFDGGVLSKGLEENRTGSTVVDLSNRGYYEIIRKGISFNNVVSLLEQNGLKAKC